VRRGRVLFLWSVLAAAALAAAVFPMLARERGALRTKSGASSGARVTAPAADVIAPGADVAGLAGESAGVRVRLARLHAERARQRFDAGALGRHFGLGTGEPFVCEITASGTASIPRGALRSISVRDERGAALAPFQPSAPKADEPADPLAALLSPPPDAIGAGRAISVVLWGREPAGGARLVGLDVGEIALAPARMTARELDTALARVDAPEREGAQ
jgi:hypothetical protein